MSTNSSPARFIIVTTTEGPEAFAVGPAGPIPAGFRLYTGETFTSKEAAQEWLWSELECWAALG